MARKRGFIPEQPGFAGFDRPEAPQGSGLVRGCATRSAREVPRRSGGGQARVMPGAGQEGAGRTAEGMAHAPVGQADLFSFPFPPLPRTVFLPEEVRLTPVAVASLGGRGGEDGFLYLVVTQGRAARLLEQGLPLSRRAPLMLTERDGVMPWLAWLNETQSEEPDAEPKVVLRVRRAMVADVLEADPDHTAAFSAPCYWLSGA